MKAKKVEEGSIESGGGTVRAVKVTQPIRKRLSVTITGVSPLVMHRFGPKARKEYEERMAKSDAQKRTEKKDRPKRDRTVLDKEYKDAFYQAPAGWYGIPAKAIREAMIEAGGMEGKYMTALSRALFVLADGCSKPEAGEAFGTPLVKISQGDPQRHECMVRLSGIDKAPDIRVRPSWLPGWEVRLVVEYDTLVLKSDEDVLNLLARAGFSIGLLEGRPSSPKSHGQDWGMFEVKGKKVAAS